jgi:hypothetical protein
MGRRKDVEIGSYHANKGAHMKSFSKSLCVVVIMAAVVWPEYEAHFKIHDNVSVLAKYYFIHGADVVQIDSGHKIYSMVPNSSVTTDSLIILSDLEKIRIRSMSFSRNGTVVLSADTFPPSDSLKWKLSKWENTQFTDTMRLRGSFLELCCQKIYRVPYNYATVTWHLKKKYTINAGDTFTLILSEMPKIPPLSDAVPQNGSSFKPVNSQSSGTFVVIDPRIGLYLRGEPLQAPIFDVSGKRQISVTGRKFVFVMPHATR